MSKRSIIWLIFILLAVLLLILPRISSPKTSAQTTSGNLTGWAWSSNIGWISFQSTGSIKYGVEKNSQGELSGYAWSTHLGWISFNKAELVNCPADQCVAKMIEGKLSGWARVCLVFQNNCSGPLKSEYSLGGFDGWISLDSKSLDSIIYGTQVSADSANNGLLEGFAWGSSVVGWISFNPNWPIPDGGNPSDPSDPSCSGVCLTDLVNLPIPPDDEPEPPALPKILPSCGSIQAQAKVGDKVVWRAGAGQSGDFVYTWSGSDGLSQTGVNLRSFEKVYSIAGVKTVTIAIKPVSPDDLRTATCNASVRIISPNQGEF